MKKSKVGYGVFVKAYGGMIAWAETEETARAIANYEYSEVSMSRSYDEFKVRKVTIQY